MENKPDSSTTPLICDPERLDRVLGRAKEVFVDAGKAEEWLNTPNVAFGDKPASLLVSEAGERAVLAALNSIEYGEVV